MTDRHESWNVDGVRSLSLDVLDERLSGIAWCSRSRNGSMAQSLQRYGQVSPIAICVHEGSCPDRWLQTPARGANAQGNELSAGPLSGGRSASAKAAVYNLNRVGHRPVELEEAWIVHALVRDDGLAQVEAALLLGRHKSWVNRRLAPLERLCDEAREELRLGLLTPSLARQLTRLPRGNQAEALKTARDASLTSRDSRGWWSLLLASSTQEQKSFVLGDPGVLYGKPTIATSIIGIPA